MAGQPRQRFRYVDRGIMATIGRSAAVARVGKLEFSGFLGLDGWLFIHLMALVFRNRLFTLLSWSWAYFTYRRAGQLILGRGASATAPREFSQHCRQARLSGGAGQIARDCPARFFRLLSAPSEEECHDLRRARRGRQVEQGGAVGEDRVHPSPAATRAALLPHGRRQWPRGGGSIGGVPGPPRVDLGPMP